MKYPMLPSCSCVNITIRMPHMDANKMREEKVRLEHHKNSMSYFKQILEAIPHKTAVVQPLTSHLKSYPSKRWTSYFQVYYWRCKNKLINNILLLTLPMNTHQCWLTNKDLYQLCVDSGDGIWMTVNSVQLKDARDFLYFGFSW